MTATQTLTLAALEALLFGVGAQMMVRAVRDGLLRKRITRYGQVLEGKKAVGSALVLLLFSVLALVVGMVLGWGWLKDRIVW